MNRQLSRRIGGIIVALAAVLALAACSAVRLGYMNLPHLAWWWLDGYADFSDAQEPRVREAIAALHAWHRQDELPRIGALLARMEQMAPGEITPQQACTIVQEVQARLQAVGRQAEGDVVALAATLTPHQLRHLARKFRGNDERFRSKWIDVAPDEQLAERYEQMLERAEAVYGTLEEPQRAVLRQRLAATSWDPHQLLAQRQRRQQELLHILTHIAQGLPAAQGRVAVRGWMDRVARPDDPADAARREAVLQEGCATFAAVHQVTTAAQRDHAVRRLRAWQRDVRELSAAQP